MKKYNFEIKLDAEKDAWNYWRACNFTSHGVDWKKKVSPEIVSKITGTSEKESYVFLIPFLTEKYKNEKNEISEKLQVFKKELDENLEKACLKLEEVIDKPMYRDNFTFFLTTLDRCPYNKQNGYIWLSIKSKSPLNIVLHELCHFQFIHYWRENPESKIHNLSNNDFEFLKESLTMILDENFIPLISRPDTGYPIHTPFREELERFWQRNKNFDSLVNYGLEKLPEFIKNISK